MDGNVRERTRRVDTTGKFYKKDRLKIPGQWGCGDQILFN